MRPATIPHQSKLLAMASTFSISGALTAGLIALALLAGCDNTINILPDDIEGIYSVYGYLEVGESPSHIRVRDLSVPMATDPDAAIDVTVTLENLAEGTSEQMEHELAEFDGIYVHNFRADMPVAPDTRYQLTVERSDGAATMTTARTPPEIETSIGPEGGNCLQAITVEFDGESDTRLLETAIGFHYNGRMRWAEDAGSWWTHGDAAMLQFTPEAVLTAWIDSVDDPDEELFYTPRCTELDQDYFYVAYTHYGPDWLHADQPTDPRRSLGVENGLGFFGGLYEGSTLSVYVDPSKIEIPPSL